VPSIQGRITAKRLAPVGEVTVELLNSSGDIVDQIRAAHDGEFVLYVSPGTWRLSAYDHQGQRGEATIRVKDAETQVELSLV
jgi:hypothetical protein